MRHGVIAVGQERPCPCCKPAVIGKLTEAGAAKSTVLLVNMAQLMLNSCPLADKLHPFDFFRPHGDRVTYTLIQRCTGCFKTHIHATLDPQMNGPSESCF